MKVITLKLAKSNTIYVKVMSQRSAAEGSYISHGEVINRIWGIFSNWYLGDSSEENILEMRLQETQDLTCVQLDKFTNGDIWRTMAHAGFESTQEDWINYAIEWFATEIPMEWLSINKLCESCEKPLEENRSHMLQCAECDIKFRQKTKKLEAV